MSYLTLSYQLTQNSEVLGLVTHSTGDDRRVNAQLFGEVPGGFGRPQILGRAVFPCVTRDESLASQRIRLALDGIISYVGIEIVIESVSIVTKMKRHVR